MLDPVSRKPPSKLVALGPSVQTRYQHGIGECPLLQFPRRKLPVGFSEVRLILPRRRHLVSAHRIGHREGKSDTNKLGTARTIDLPSVYQIIAPRVPHNLLCDFNAVNLEPPMSFFCTRPT